ncbi:PRTRC system protein B [Galbibacter sp. EGI 63066]|uniref:PRTRC system protein B n=1 Tax=Galbibacter sp. EGI 63066 TaxID=2993559 RepID=UPI0022488C4B|nr:PRTRC system protein B [Galbibacter sp. EGI 63066]MCX2681005.1 PRTRC system protein B [Galbibacter sp. EGI 63066]
MEARKNITGSLGTLYHPKSALVFYQSNKRENDTYVEHFDMDKNGNPVNAHPLSVREAQRLSKVLDTQEESRRAFLKPGGLLPLQVLHLDPSENGSVLWYTKPTKKNLYFIDGLGIPGGKANIPSLLWFATKQHLKLFALASGRRPKANTLLYHAPFFNISSDGNVCMGTVDINILSSASLEEFTAAWEDCFFNSYFSHLMHGHNPVRGNCVNLWKKLMETGEEFPKEVLKKNRMTVNDLIR